VILSGLVVFSAHAQTVHKWVDEEGVTHYSDKKSASDETEVNKIEVPKADTVKTESEEINTRIKDQLQQMEQDRKEAERIRQEEKKARAIEESLQREALIPEEPREKKDKGSGRRRPVPLPGSKKP